MSTGTTIYVDNTAEQAIEIQVIDLLGRVVHRFTNQSPNADRQIIRWDGKDNNGNYLPNGIYLVVAQQNHIIKTQKIVCLR